VDVNDISNCSDSTFFAVSADRVMYRSYLDSVTNNFNEDYIKTTLTAGDLEQFAVTYGTSEYRYTLYYYDQGRNLVKTVPPAGVTMAGYQRRTTVRLVACETGAYLDGAAYQLSRYIRAPVIAPTKEIAVLEGGGYIIRGGGGGVFKTFFNTTVTVTPH
jgi:hypothetical protein